MPLISRDSAKKFYFNAFKSIKVHAKLLKASQN
jgi:hypothetical protein